MVPNGEPTVDRLVLKREQVGLPTVGGNVLKREAYSFWEPFNLL